MHKVVTKTELAAQGIPVPRGTVVLRGTMPTLGRVLTGCKLKLPVVVKPASQGSTIGVTIVREAGAVERALRVAHRYEAEAMVEGPISPDSVTVSLLGDADGWVTGPPAVEIVAPDGFHDPRQSMKKAGHPVVCPAPYRCGWTKQIIRKLAIRTYHAVGCSGAARVDFRITPKGTNYVLEINTVPPRMTETSLPPMAAGKAGCPTMSSDGTNPFNPRSGEPARNVSSRGITIPLGIGKARPSKSHPRPMPVPSPDLIAVGVSRQADIGHDWARGLLYLLCGWSPR